ncbi:MAG: class I adenylate-forming enzyme family protein [Syntrophales bacterium]|nr:class I adenylate-forming enzyme family protein [Syntrophales bacterium]
MKTIISKTNTINNRIGYQDILCLPPEAHRDFILNGCTYEELYRLAGGLSRLSRASESEDPLICLCTDDKALLMAALLASLAGGPRLVLPHAFSRQAVADVHESLSPEFYLTDSTEQTDAPAGSKIVTPSSLTGDVLDPASMRDPDEPFLILFTGGSTGNPQMWPKTPRNMLAEACFQVDTLGMTGEDIFLSTVPPNHIYGLLFSVLAPFISRARILKETCVFPREIIRAARDFQASILVSVPAHYRVLRTEALNCGHLRIALSSAGTLDREDGAFFHDKTGLEITEIFGSTETGGIAQRRRSQDGESWIPLPPVDWKIDEGKLCVRSDFLSPALPRDGEGFFMTADRIDADGNDRFILRGRTDTVVKIGGNRVDMAEIQAKLKQIPGVRDAFVVSLPVGKGRQNELAAVVATDLTVARLRRQIAQICEAYAVPKRLAVVDEIPLTPAGKYIRSKIDGILRRGTSVR